MLNITNIILQLNNNCIYFVFILIINLFTTYNVRYLKYYTK